jgi:hypothetical protein
MAEVVMDDWTRGCAERRRRNDHAAEEFVASARRLQRLLVERRYREDQRRVPPGNPDGGRWTTGDGGSGTGRRRDGEAPPDDPARSRDPTGPVQLAGGFKEGDLDLTVQKFVAMNCRGRIHAELPGQFYGMTIKDVIAADERGDRAARTCIKLLKQDRFRK